MAMNDAFLFFGTCRADDAFRFRLYGAADGDAFRALVAGAGFRFSPGEAEDALRSMKLRARDEYEAGEIDELAHWFKLMSMEGPAAGGSSRCSPSACSSCPGCR